MYVIYIILPKRYQFYSKKMYSRTAEIIRRKYIASYNAFYASIDTRFEHCNFPVIEAAFCHAKSEG